MSRREKKVAEATHTPGPWRTGHLGEDRVYTKSGAQLCTVMPRRDDPSRSSQEDFANARLIAAAPDLLEVLMVVEARLDEINSRSDLSFKVRSAVAKAVGR